MTKRKLLLLLATITSIFLGVVICYCFTASDNENVQIQSSELTYQLQGWILEDGTPIELPYSVHGKKGETIGMSCTLPKHIPDYFALCFRSVYCRCEVYAEEELIGSYGTRQALPTGEMVGNIRVFVPVSPDMAEKEVTIKMTPYYTTNMNIPLVKLGFSEDLEFRVLKENMWRILVCTFLFTMAMLSLGIAIYQSKRHFFENNKMFFYFGVLVMLIIAWLICDSDIPQFYTDCSEAVSLCSFLFLAMFPIPFLGYCRQVLSRGKEILYYLEIGAWIMPFMVAFCFVTGICDPPISIHVIHISMMLIVGIVLWFALREWSHSVDSRILVGGIVEIVVASIIGLACFYVSPIGGYAAAVFGSGFVIFCFTLFALIVYREVNLLEEKKFLDIYKELAYKDILTGLGNRAAFEWEFSNMKDYATQATTISLLVLDLNYLKRTNDSAGHHAGDEIICGMGECMERTFGDRNKCFRLGGDEFAVLLFEDEEGVETLLERFQKNIALYNKFHRYKLSVAKGLARMKWRSDETFYRDIFKAADEAMYADKQKCHHMEAED